MKRKKYFFLYFILFLVLIITLFFVINYFTDIFDPIIEKIFKKSGEIIPQTERFLMKQAFAGISIGTFILVFVLLIYPLLFTSIDAQSYYRDFFFGILTAIVFYITEQFKLIITKFKTVDFLLVILAIIIFTYIIIELVASLFKNKQKALTFKSQTIANILSGIVFSMILTIIKSLI
ncbi:MAG TPA: hypothetical protein PLF21_07485 [Exilispira sp.]|nr:hypothetical protein [Exilispira sp.]